MRLAWGLLTDVSNHVMARLANVRFGPEHVVSGSCVIKCHHPKFSSYCSTLDGKPSYVF